MYYKEINYLEILSHFFLHERHIDEGYTIEVTFFYFCLNHEEKKTIRLREILGIVPTSSSGLAAAKNS